ncbi:hypothetical protein MB901379_01277 [Mycobacterium basiliense]|uniref:Uncharacterized protein n=1 Tax=Mycobacterium basiliense TaxID=2094119 RepID=A0A447GB84_9MYCO|nr:hypothetical protein [Mycobacterium basiliense]VDM87732.1 hypothetical protein MB901379_01277 [Mycobacterium basiliense]
MAIQDWRVAPEIHPSEIRVGDIIGTMQPTHLPFRVKLITEPQRSPKQWTFFGQDDNGRQHVSTVCEDQLVRRYSRQS